MAQARYKQFVDAFAEKILSGELQPGTRLPQHRQLADDHGLALVTATRVYAELGAMGLVSGETGRGTFVRDTSLPRGLGIDQHATADDIVDLNFNYAAMPEQANGGGCGRVSAADPAQPARLGNAAATAARHGRAGKTA